MIIRSIFRIIFFLFVLINLSCQKKETKFNSENEFYKVKNKSFEILVTDTGEVSSEIEYKVLSPFSTKVNDLLPEGTLVKKGQKIGSLEIIKEREKKEEAEIKAKEIEFDLKIERLENQKNLEKLEIYIERAEIDLKIAQLNLDKLKNFKDDVQIVTNSENLNTTNKEIEIYKLEVEEKTKLLTNGFISLEELNQSKTKLQELIKQKEFLIVKDKKLSLGTDPSEIKKKVLDLNQKKIILDKLKKELSITKKKASLNIKDKKVRLEKSIESVAYYENLANKGELHSEANGIIVYGKMNIGREEVKVKPGDSIKEGVNIATIIDINRPMIKMLINEVDISQIKIGQKARFSLDSYPNSFFNSEVIKIDPVARKKLNYMDQNNVIIFETHLKIIDKNPKIKSGMTANVEIVVSKEDKVIAIPSQAIFLEGNSSYCFIKKEDSIIKQKLELGNSNELETVVKKGLKQDNLVLLNPKDQKI